MIVRFKHGHLKILVTRISGFFNIYSEEKQCWDKKVTRGSFKIKNERIYDATLEKINAMKGAYEYKIYLYDLLRAYHHQFKELAYQPTSPHLVEEGYIVFEVNKGVVVNVDVSNPKINSNEVVIYRPHPDSNDEIYIRVLHELGNPEHRLTKIPNEVVNFLEYMEKHK